MAATVKVMERRGSSLADRMYLPAVLGGLKVTTRHFVRNLLGRKETSTISYPEETVRYAPRWRGKHRLVPREDGTARCVACFMCSTACPARCIHIVAGEHEPAAGTPEGAAGREKMPVRFEIDELRCIYCGMCVEACPCDAIRMDTGIHASVVSDREDAWVDKAILLARPARDYQVTPEAAGPPCAVHTE